MARTLEPPIVRRSRPAGGRAAVAALAAAMLVTGRAAAGASDPIPRDTQAPVATASDGAVAPTFNPPFPRIGVLYFYEVNIPEEIWKGKDLIATRYWYPEIARRIKARYPEKIVLGANNIIDGVGIFSSGDHPAEDAWLVPLTGGTTPTSPSIGNPYCVQGWHMNQHPGNCLYDGTDTSPRLSAFGGRRWNEYLPYWLNTHMDWSVFDGVFWDSWAGGLWSNADRVDLDRNGQADGQSLATSLWLQGNRRIVENLRLEMPAGRLVAAHETAPDEYSYLNGRGFEFWKGHDWQWVYDNILTPFSQNAVQPRVNFLEGQGASPEDFATMRFGLATAALADAYFYFEQSGTAHQLDYHYDEFDANLGYPTGPAQPIRPGVYVRYFDNGAVVVNGSGAPQTVGASDLAGGPYYRFQGGQVPAFNNGHVVSDADPVVLAGSGAPSNLGSQTGDGILLFRAQTTIVSDIIVDNVARNMTSPGSSPASYAGSWTQQDMGQIGGRPTLGYALLYGWDQYGPPYAKTTQAGAAATYRPTIGVTGTYEVFEWHPVVSDDAQGTSCASVSVAINHAAGTANRTVDQTVKEPDGSQRWRSLGVYTFNAGTSGTVVLTAPGGCTAVSDAIRFAWSPSGTPTADKPVMTPAPGSYQGTVTVALYSATAGAEVRYTTNGTLPGPTSTLYAAPFTLGSTTTVEARAFKSGFNPSDVAVGVFTITVDTGDSTPPTLAGITAQNLTSSGATIAWTTDEPSSSQVEYGTTTSYGSASPINAQLVTAHSVLLSGLTAGTTYHFRVVSTDAAGNRAQSGDGAFTTPAPSQAEDALHDDFEAGSLDTQKWLRGTNAGNQATVGAGVLTLQSSGDESGWVTTSEAFTARNTSATVKVVQPSEDFALGMSPTYTLSSTNGLFGEPAWYRFYTYRSASSGPYLLYAQWKRNGIVDGLDVTGSLVIPGTVFLRIRMDDTDIHFEASLDGTSWVDTHHEAFSLPGASLDSRFHYELSGWATYREGVPVVDDFSIRGGSYTGEVLLEWNPVVTNADGSALNDLAGYRLFRGRSSLLGRSVSQLMADSSVIQTFLPASATSSLVSGLERGVAHYFRLVAVDSVGNVSGLNLDLGGQEAEVVFTAPLQ
jgi:hypothetical protein